MREGYASEHGRVLASVIRSSKLPVRMTKLLGYVAESEDFRVFHSLYPLCIKQRYGSAGGTLCLFAFFLHQHGSGFASSLWLFGLCGIYGTNLTLLIS